MNWIRNNVGLSIVIGVLLLIAIFYIIIPSTGGLNQKPNADGTCDSPLVVIGGRCIPNYPITPRIRTAKP